MADGMPRGSRAWLTLQWRNALALLVAGILLGGLDVALTFSQGLPRGGETVLLVVILVIAVGLVGGSAYLFREVTRGESRLRERGVPWQAERSLVGTTRRSLVTHAPPETALSAARAALADPDLGLTHVGRDLLGGVRAIRPAESGVLVLYVRPLAVRIRARRQRDRTVVTVTVVPSSLYGWPVLYGWVGWSEVYTWIGVAEELADALTNALTRSLDGAAGVPAVPFRNARV